MHLRWRGAQGGFQDWLLKRLLKRLGGNFWLVQISWRAVGCRYKRLAVLTICSLKTE